MLNGDDGGGGGRLAYIMSIIFSSLGGGCGDYLHLSKFSIIYIHQVSLLGRELSHACAMPKKYYRCSYSEMHAQLLASEMNNKQL